MLLVTDEGIYADRFHITDDEHQIAASGLIMMLNHPRIRGEHSLRHIQLAGVALSGAMGKGMDHMNDLIGSGDNEAAYIVYSLVALGQLRAKLTVDPVIVQMALDKEKLIEITDTRSESRDIYIAVPKPPSAN